MHGEVHHSLNGIRADCEPPITEAIFEKHELLLQDQAENSKYRIATNDPARTFFAGELNDDQLRDRIYQRTSGVIEDMPQSPYL